jgi:RNase P/RNase MRP subunit p30
MKDINLFRLKDSLCLKKVSKKDEVSKDENCDGFLIDSSEKEARRIIESLKGTKKKIAIIGGDDAFNRRAIESLKIDYLVSPEGSKKFDNLKQRDSGLNHVVVKIAKEKGILIVVDFGEISRLEKKEKAEKIARVAQNVKICRKVGCEIRIASLSKKKTDIVDKLGRKSFGITVGMSSNEVRNCVEF